MLASTIPCFRTRQGSSAWRFTRSSVRKGRRGSVSSTPPTAPGRPAAWPTIWMTIPRAHESVIREWTATDPSAHVFSGTSREVFGSASSRRTTTSAPSRSTPMPSRGRRTTACSMPVSVMGGRRTTRRTSASHSPCRKAGIIRIDPLAGDGDQGYGIPADNPFVGREGGSARDLGLRPPPPAALFLGHRWPDVHRSRPEPGRGGQPRPARRQLWLAAARGDVRQRLRRGAGDRDRSFPLPSPDEGGFVYPVAQYDHDEVRGRWRVRISRAGDSPAAGKYVFADFPRGRLLSIDADALDPVSWSRSRRSGWSSGAANRIWSTWQASEHLRPRQQSGPAPRNRLGRRAVSADQGRRLGTEARTRTLTPGVAQGFGLAFAESTQR